MKLDFMAVSANEFIVDLEFTTVYRTRIKIDMTKDKNERLEIILNTLMEEIIPTMRAKIKMEFNKRLEG